MKHRHKHKDIRVRRMAYLTQFSIPALLNLMINKMADDVSAILLLICSHGVWVTETYDWSTALCLCLSINQSMTLFNFEFVDSKIANISEENKSVT